MKTYQKWEFLHSCAVPFTIGVVIGFVYRISSGKPYSKAFVIGECILTALGIAVSIVSGIMKQHHWNKYINGLLEEHDENDRR